MRSIYVVLIIPTIVFFYAFYSTIENSNGKLILSSEMNGDTFVNGQVRHIFI